MTKGLVSERVRCAIAAGDSTFSQDSPKHESFCKLDGVFTGTSDKPDVRSKFAATVVDADASERE